LPHLGHGTNSSQYPKFRLVLLAVNVDFSVEVVVVYSVAIIVGSLIFCMKKANEEKK
jgi:hypothetical protein